jgi:hypothetical protein
MSPAGPTGTYKAQLHVADGVAVAVGAGGGAVPLPNPVDVYTGAGFLESQDLGSEGLGRSWGHTRQFTTILNGNNPNGRQWVVGKLRSLQRLHYGGDTDTLVAVDSGTDFIWFPRVPPTTLPTTSPAVPGDTLHKEGYTILRKDGRGNIIRY